MKLNKKKMTAIIVGILLALAIIAIKHKKTELAKIPVMKSYAVVVQTMRAKKSDVTLEVPYLATVMSDSSAILSTRTAARVIRILPSGSRVKKQQVVAELDGSDLRQKAYALKLQNDSTATELSAKRIALANAMATHRRTLKLLKVKGASIEMSQREETTIKGLEAMVKSLENKIKILQSDLSEIETALSYTTLRSPIDGKISKSFVNVGEMAMPGKPLLRIESEEGKYLLIRTADTPHTNVCIFEGKRYEMRSLETTYNGLLEYRANVSTDRKSGERVPVSILTFKGEGIKLPVNTLLQKEGRTYVLVVKHNKAKALAVNILARGEDGVVVDGLSGGEEVVVAKPDILLQLLAGKPVAVANKTQER